MNPQLKYILSAVASLSCYIRHRLSLSVFGLFSDSFWAPLWNSVRLVTVGCLTDDSKAGLFLKLRLILLIHWECIFSVAAKHVKQTWLKYPRDDTTFNSWNLHIFKSRLKTKMEPYYTVARQTQWNQGCKLCRIENCSSLCSTLFSILIPITSSGLCKIMNIMPQQKKYLFSKCLVTFSGLMHIHISYMYSKY